MARISRVRMTAPQPPKRDIVETLVALAGTLGMNRMRVRWKLLQWRKSLASWQEHKEAQLQHAAYGHAVCPQCGQVQDRSERVCRNCGVRLGGRPGQLLRRLGLVVPTALSVSTLLGMLLSLCYLRLMLARPGSGFFSVPSEDLVYLGAYFLPAIRAGELWRHATAMFLHIGLLHLAFNMLALAQIGPSIEDTFGRARMLLIFLLTGIVGFVACQVWAMPAVSAGASGAVMGLCGAAAGWGQRDGTRAGKTVRNQMLTWAAYTMLFGALVHANNIAHAGGFASGAFFGFLMPPRWLRRGYVRNSDVALGLVATVLLVATVVLVFRPPASSEAWANAYGKLLREQQRR